MSDKIKKLLSDQKARDERKRRFDEVLRQKAAVVSARDERSARPEPGDPMPDGTICAGISPETNQPMYTTTADAPLTMIFNEAKEYAAKLDAHGHQDWHVPTKAELNVLFNNRAAIGGFDVSGSDPAGWYWSSSQGSKWNAWCRRFSDGSRNDYPKLIHLSVRPVR
jgi:hypothetical protein